MKPAQLQINKAHYPVTVLGPGQRIGIWVQGCSIHCKHCVSMDTWDADPKRAIHIPDIMAWCRKVAASGCDGVTISGGEPFDQPQGLRALLVALHGWRKASGRDFDILCYSGYPLRTLEGRHRDILDLLDAVIPEPYVENAPPTAIWCGSANQRLEPLSDRGRAVYAEFVDAPQAGNGKQMQVAVEGGRVWMIGIPARGDMDKLEALCAARGLSMQQVSWRR
jgi:anaerobic ribonucleoside-triphosphate reductase activating protein